MYIAIATQTTDKKARRAAHKKKMTEMYKKNCIPRPKHWDGKQEVKN